MRMRKENLTIGAVVVLGVLSAFQGGQGAETKNKEKVKKATEKKMALKAAADATAAAAQAFEKVSKELYPKAKQEGNLIIYSVWDVEHLRAIMDAFMKKYPGIKAIYWQGTNPNIVTSVV